MNQDLAMVTALRRALEAAGQGRGMSASLVRELRGAGSPGSDVSQKVLLGHPPEIALRPLVQAASVEVSMLASLIASARKSSADLVGRTGGNLAGILERWVKLRENMKLEMKVQRYRGAVTSGVLGAVSGMVASLGPLMGNLGAFGSGAYPGSGSLILAAAAMTAISSGMLGFYMSGRRLYVNVGIALAAFAVASSLAAPLADVSAVSLWGVK